MTRLSTVFLLILCSCYVFAQVPSLLFGPDGQKPKGTAWHPLFNAISIEGAADVEIVIGLRNAIYKDGEKVKAEKVRGGVLLLADVGDYKIVVTSLDKIIVNGAADITFTQIDCDKFTIVVQGACDATLAGKVKTFIVDVKGAADLFAFDLRSRTTRVSVKGAADAMLWVTSRLFVDIKGAGDVVYRGNPWVVQEDIQGAGDISRIK